MRVASNTFSNGLVNQLNLLAARQQRLQYQAATGQRIQAPEDDPGAVQRTLDLNAEAEALQQFTNNIATLKEKAGTAFDTLKGMKAISDRVGEIATLADGTRSPDELHIYGNEVTQLIQHAVQLMNGKFRGDYLFGGTRTDQPPFTMTQDANGRVTSVTYQGDTSVAQSEIEPGVTLSVDVPGANNSGVGARGLVSDNRVGADFFNHLISLQNHLMAGDSAGVATDRPNLAKDEDNFLFQVGTNGAVQTRLESTSTAAGTRSMSLEQMTSREADADLTDTLMHLSQAQTAYQAALQSGASIMSRSLLDYLK